MSTRVHARGDGSFGRSAGSQTLKGAALLAVAVAIGVLLLRTAPSNTTTVSTSNSSALTPATTKAPRQSHQTIPPTTAPPAPTSTVPQKHTASQVSIAVANGSGVNGLAARIRTQLNSAGYNTSTPALNASSTPTSSVYYVAGYQADATAIATDQLNLPASAVKPMPSPAPVPASSLAGVQVLVIAGADIGGSPSSATQAPSGNTVAPSSGTVSSGGTTTTVHHTTTTLHTSTSASHTTTTAAHTTTTA